MTPAAAELDRTLLALADPVRRRTVELLRQGPQRPGALAAAFQVSAPAMSKHLRVLRDSRLIEEIRVEGDARIRLYGLRGKPFDELGAWLEQVRSFWTDQLDAFKQHVDRTRRTRR